MIHTSIKGIITQEQIDSNPPTTGLYRVINYLTGLAGQALAEHKAFNASTSFSIVAEEPLRILAPHNKVYVR